MNSILCAIDFSEPSIRSLKWALDLSAELQSPLEILYTYRLQEADENVWEYRRKLEQDARQKFKDLESRVNTQPDMPYTFSVEVGFLPDRIRARLKQTSFRLVVIPNHMTDQLLSAGLHLNTKDLIREFKVPVLFHE